MTSQEEILEGIRKAVINYDEKMATDLAKKVIDEGVNPLTAIEEGLAKGIKVVGDKFEKQEIFLPHIVLASDVMKKALEVLEPHLKKGETRSVSGKIVIGTVQGDIHDIGKNIVRTMLDASGFQTFDIGCDAPTSKFIEKAQEVNADIIAASALMTTSMYGQRDLVEELRKMGLKDSFRILIGGGLTSKDWAEEIGADGYAEDAIQAVKVAEKIVKGEK